MTWLDRPRTPPPRSALRSPRAALAGLPALALAAALGCTSTYDRGEALYRQGDLRGALEIWNGIGPSDGAYPRVADRAEVVRSELDRSFRLYEKRGRFYEDEARPAEALLYYRLALKLDPSQAPLMNRVQGLVRELAASKRGEREQLAGALQRGDLLAARRHAEALEQLDPFDPAVKIEVRDARSALGTELARHIEAGKQLYASGAHEQAAEEFSAALALDDDNEEALGYVYYIRSLQGVPAEADDADEGATRPVAATRGAAAAASTAPESTPLGGAPRRPARPPITQEEILAEGHFRSATQAEKQNDVYWAIQQYDAALRVNPRHEAARRRLEQLRERLAPEVERLYELGKRYFREEDVQNALVMWRRVLLIDPERERTSRNVQDAEKILSRLEELQSGD
jgi:tetratricopeptide (TPR) repeat protein